MHFFKTLISAIALILTLAASGKADEEPNFVTYAHDMAEPGNLEVSVQSTVGLQKKGLPDFLGQLLEMEYGITPWWSSAIYFEGASQGRAASTVFTGFRLENRLRLMKAEHRMNPVLYFEYENINEASSILKEIVGHTYPSSEPFSKSVNQIAREVEAKLILSSNMKGWNISYNFIAEKNLVKSEGFEFGNALGIFRSLSEPTMGANCRLCREKLAAGLEFYGGMGSSRKFGFKDTSNYLAPTISWNLANNQVVKLSPAFGLTGSSCRMILRFGYSYEIDGLAHKVAQLFRAR